MDENKITMKELLNDCKEKYSKVRKLLDEEPKTSEPYLSKYKAKNILNEMRHTLEQVPNEIAIDAMLGAVLLQIGIIDMDTEELSSSEKILNEAEVLLCKHSTHPRVMIILLNVYNNLGILWCNREFPETAKTYLLKAKELYENFKCTLQMPLSIEYQFGLVEENSEKDVMFLEKAFTLTLYYLAQVYGALKLELKSAVYCHVTLKRQLQYNDYEPIDWALNSATLSQYFAVQNGFFQSRHHLAAASVILEKYEAKLLQSDTGDEQYQAKLETLKHRSADIALCWTKYCLNLMASSKTRLLNEDVELSNAATDMSNLTIEDEENICNGDIKSLVFDVLDVSSKENIITDKFLLTFDDARKVFLALQIWMDKAKEYYSLENLASDYIKIVQDQSQALSLLAFFEEDDARRAKMHKKRITWIEELLKNINSEFYMQYCRQLWYELGEVYTDMLNIKLDKWNNSSDKPTPHAIKKINMLSDKSVKNYELFINSFKDARTKVLPTVLEEEYVRPVVNAYVMIGRNTMKKIAVEHLQQLANTTKTYESYKAAVDYCDRDEKALALMSEEISLCKEMISILPLKINKIHKAMAQFNM